MSVFGAHCVLWLFQFLMFSVCSWNVRGLNNPAKRSAVRFVISKLRSTIVCLQETKVHLVSGSFLRSFGGSHLDKCHFIEADGASGGLITCWSSRFFVCSEVIVCNFSLTLNLRHRPSGVQFFVSNVYGPPRWDGKEQFCAELALLKDYCRGNWVVCGDFNFTRTQEERSGKLWSNRASKLFNDLIFDLALIDLPMKNARFTWSSMQRNPTLARLDRFLISTEWDCSFPLSEVEALSRITSDHCPIVLSTGAKPKPTGGPFRFEALWLRREDFISSIPIWWREVSDRKSGILTFTAKLRHCRKMIKKWRATHFYSINSVKSGLSSKISCIDKLEEQHELAPDLFEKRERLRAELGRVLDDEELLWKTRAKQNWLREGDRNTKFFHAVANGRRRNNEVGTIADDGRSYHSEEDKRSYFHRKFKALFAPEDTGPANFGDWSDLFRSRRLTDADRASLTAPFSPEEIRTAVFQLGGDKAPGPDGFPLCFYQTFWETMKADIWRVFQELYAGVCDTDHIDYTYVCLIPKKAGASRANDFRPISLLNGLQ